MIERSKNLWIAKFLSNYPVYKKLNSTLLERVRIKSFTIESISLHFKKHEELMMKNKCKLHLVFNIHETSFIVKKSNASYFLVNHQTILLLEAMID